MLRPERGAGMRLLVWYWGRRGGGAQYALHLARALAARRGVEVGLALSAQNELLPDFRGLRLPLQLTHTYASAAGFLAALPRVPLEARRLARAAAGHDAVLSAMTHLWTPRAMTRSSRP